MFLEQARTQLHQTLNESRDALFNLRHQATERSDLFVALSDLMRRRSADSSLVAECKMNGTPRRLTKVAETNLLRIAGEAINNAVKHSGARRLQVELSFEAQYIQLRIADDGRGFEPSAQLERSEGEHRFGLIGMRERADEIGGQFILRSAPGEGTEIIVRVPLNR